MSKAAIAVVTLGALLSGCAGDWLPWGSSDAEQPRRLPKDAVELVCAQGKQLIVRYTADGQSAWIIYPDREFRLDRVTGSGVERYTNGSTSLIVEGDALALDTDGARQFSGCRKKPSP